MGRWSAAAGQPATEGRSGVWKGAVLQSQRPWYACRQAGVSGCRHQRPEHSSRMSVRWQAQLLLQLVGAATQQQCASPGPTCGCGSCAASSHQLRCVMRVYMLSMPWPERALVHAAGMRVARDCTVTSVNTCAMLLPSSSSSPLAKGSLLAFTGSPLARRQLDYSLRIRDTFCRHERTYPAMYPQQPALQAHRVLDSDLRVTARTSPQSGTSRVLLMHSQAAVA
jgi:hypothetical protein